MNTAISLFPIFQALDDEGTPIPGARLYTYETGGDTPADVFTTKEGNVSHDNPVEADAAGRFPAIYLGPLTYQFILTKPNDEVVWAVDGVFDNFLTEVEGEVVDTESQQTISNKTIDDTNVVELMHSNFTLKGENAERARFDLTAIDDGETKTYALPNKSGTVVVVEEDGVIEDAELREPRPMTTRFQEGRGDDVSSANTLVLGEDGNTFGMTGTTDVHSIETTGWANGSVVRLVAGDAILMKHDDPSGDPDSAKMLLASGDYQMQAGDSLTLVQYDGSAWVELGRAVNRTAAIGSLDAAANIVLDAGISASNAFDVDNPLTEEVKTIDTVGWNIGNEVVLRVIAPTTFKHDTTSGAPDGKKLWLPGESDQNLDTFDVIRFVQFDDYWMCSGFVDNSV